MIPAGEGGIESPQIAAGDRGRGQIFVAAKFTTPYRHPLIAPSIGQRFLMIKTTPDELVLQPVTWRSHEMEHKDHGDARSQTRAD